MSRILSAGPCRGLLGIERSAVDFRFNPDRGPQPTVLTAVDRRGRQLLLEVLDPLQSGVRLGQASDGVVPLHPVSLRAHGHPALFNTALRQFSSAPAPFGGVTTARAPMQGNPLKRSANT